ncbi:hypothetical protein DPV78_011151 [Talaromyces pinophilus]|nr:hypothetical protein DPV78_011151 [Talaromyces pinophilus]
MERAPSNAKSLSGSIAPAAELPHQRDRRREKQQLSCNFCRSRKIRCDRQLPCKTCVSKDIALSCTYTPGLLQKNPVVSVGDRIQQLEALVRSLMQQRQQQQQPSSNEPPSGTSDNHERLRLHSNGINYISSVHWAAILDSISELNETYETERHAAMLGSINDDSPSQSPTPRLLYEPVHATKDEIISSIPNRAVVDRMVARYFNIQGVAPAVLSSVQFLKEYERFWQNPTAASFAWIGLLYSIMCLSTQYQNLADGTTDPESLMRVHIFRERTVHCLVLGQFTKDGPHILETMLIHCTSEILLCKDAEIGLWLLLGMVVQLSLSLGYHRDPRHFPHLSPFVGEMRRRVWAAMVQMDLRLSSQMGLPRLLKSEQCDTAEPRNLLDSDFDKETLQLPASRPETEVTPVLYGLAKSRIDAISVLISDLIADVHDHTFSEILHLDEKLQAAEKSLPPIFQWQPLSQSLMIPPQILLHRVALQLGVHRLTIQLHRRYLSASYAADERYKYSVRACIGAAIKILEFQQMLNEETQPDALLYSVRWMRSSLLQSVFLLGLSVLCYSTQLIKAVNVPSFDLERVLQVLHKVYPIWLSSSIISQDARKAVEHLNLVLGYPREKHRNELDAAFNNSPLGQATWNAGQGFLDNIADISQALDNDLIGWDTEISSSYNMFLSDWA